MVNFSRTHFLLVSQALVYMERSLVAFDKCSCACSNIYNEMQGLINLKPGSQVHNSMMQDSMLHKIGSLHINCCVSACVYIIL